MAKQPFAHWSDTDHSGPVVIATALTLVYWLALGVGQQAVAFGRTRVLSWASLCYAVAMLVGLAQAILVLVAASQGLGKSKSIIQDDKGTAAMRTYHISSILYVLVLAVTKVSAACSVICLTVQNGSIKAASRSYKIILLIITTVVVAWTLGSIVALALQCPSGSLVVSTNGACAGNTSAWAAIFACDAVTDLAISAFGAKVIWPTRALLRLKIIWYIPFLIRLGVIVVAGGRLAAFHHKHHETDPTISLWLFVVLTQCQIFCTLVAAGFPALKQTVLAMATNFGRAEDSQSRSRKESYALGSWPRKSKQALYASYDGCGERNLVDVQGGANPPRGDDDSQKGILRQDDFEIAVEESQGVR